MATRCAVPFLFLAMLRVHGQSPQTSTPEPVARVMVGLEQSAVGSSTPVQKLSVSLFFSEPLAARLSTWGDLRLSSLPRPVSSAVATLPADAVKLVSAVPVNELVRSGEFLVGVAYRVSGGSGPWSTLQAIASLGAATPVAPNQTRFFRQYYGGLRILSAKRTHMVDVTLGQNEAITGGRFHGAVLRFDGFYAFPVSSGNFLYLFGTAGVKSAPRVPAHDTGADAYRIGLGVDFFQLLKALRIN